MNNKLVYILMFAGLVSCEKNITLHIPSENPKLVVNGIVRNTTQFKITIGKSTGILDLNDPSSYRVSNAFVRLYENNALTDTLVFDSAADAYLSRRFSNPQAGKLYKLQASAPGFASVEAETRSPFSTIIQSVRRQVNVKKDADGNFLDEVKIAFRDDPATTNYYWFRLRRPTSVSATSLNYSGISCMKSADVDIERRSSNDPVDVDKCINQQFYMTDANFNGNTKEVQLFIKHTDLEALLNTADKRVYRAFVELQTITYDHYKYLKSYNTYRDAADNPFAEPVLVYNNIKNGYGIFTTYELARDSIR